MRGSGINVKTTDFPEELQEVGTSLKIEGGQNYRRKDVVAQVLGFFEEYYENYIQEKSLEGILKEYKALCITLKNDVRVIIKGGAYWAKPLDIDKDGSLMVEREDGSHETITSGEVSVRGIYGYV